MQTSIFRGPRDIDVIDVPDPRPAPGEVVVRVRAAGVCGGDLHEYRADRQLYATPYPRPAQGHEAAGEVIAIGEGVMSVQPGARVAIQPMISCGDCPPCAAGNWSLCERLEHIGVARPGGFAEQCAAPAENVFMLPNNVSFEEGALLDCTAVAVHALDRVPVPSGAAVVVLGAGAIGLAIAQVARAAGAGHVTVVATRPGPLEVARTLGADAAIDLGAGDAGPTGDRSSSRPPAGRTCSIVRSLLSLRVERWVSLERASTRSSSTSPLRWSAS